jgi:hypothetical protein
MRPRRLEIVVLLTLVAVIGYQLFVPPLVGIADNGDSWRVMFPAGLNHRPAPWGDRFFRYFNSKYAIETFPRVVPDYLSSSLVFVWMARALNMAVVDRAIFDVRVLAALYLVCLLASIHLILVASRRLTTTCRAAIRGIVAVRA